MFALAILFACVEKLCSIMNLVAVEKDWVRYYMNRFLIPASGMNHGWLIFHVR